MQVQYSRRWFRSGLPFCTHAPITKMQWAAAVCEVIQNCSPVKTSHLWSRYSILASAASPSRPGLFRRNHADLQVTPLWGMWFCNALITACLRRRWLMLRDSLLELRLFSCCPVVQLGLTKCSHSNQRVCASSQIINKQITKELKQGEKGGLSKEEGPRTTPLPLE